MNHILNCGYEIKWSYDPRSYERNYCNWVEKPEKFRTSTGFELVTSRYRCTFVPVYLCDALLVLWGRPGAGLRSKRAISPSPLITPLTHGTEPWLLLCLTPDDFTRQLGVSRGAWGVNGFFTMTAKFWRAHWLIFIVNKRTDTQINIIYITHAFRRV